MERMRVEIAFAHLEGRRVRACALCERHSRECVVRHERNTSCLACFERAAVCLLFVLAVRSRVSRQANLDANDHVSIFFDHLDQRRNLDLIEAVQLPTAPSASGTRACKPVH
eukprot:COSAG02_NODE_177_length_31154_cov_32.205152_10_plen_112_part_00